MKISKIITNKYKLRIPPTVYYDLLADVLEVEEPNNKNDCETCMHNKGFLECDMYGCKYEPTTKDDLGVDWESYKDVDGNSLDDLILEVLQNNFDCGNTYGYKVADEIIGLLPSVTPQEPRKGHWLGDSAGYKCNICGHDLLEIAHSIDYIDFQKPNYCPNCGAKMVEPQESEDKE